MKSKKTHQMEEKDMTKAQELTIERSRKQSLNLITTTVTTMK